MWVEIKETKEWVPFDADHTDKVFLDGEKGWAIKQKDGKVYHVSKEQYERKMLKELDSEIYWKLRQIEDSTQGLSKDDIALVKKLLKTIQKRQDKKEEEDE